MNQIEIIDDLVDLIELIIGDLVKRLREVGCKFVFDDPDIVDRHTFTVHRNAVTFYMSFVSDGSVAIWANPITYTLVSDEDIFYFPISDPEFPECLVKFVVERSPRI